MNNNNGELDWLARYRAHNDALAARQEATKMDTINDSNQPGELPILALLSPRHGLRFTNEVRLLISRIERIAGLNHIAQSVRSELYEVAEVLESFLEVK